MDNSLNPIITNEKLGGIKHIVDSYYEGNIIVTVGNQDCAPLNHVYDLSMIMGMLSNLVYEALNLDVPCRKGVRK